jgi:sec-independent protein translocase protein TatB
MFNINSWELLIIVAIALVVVGPERLPGLLLQAGRLLQQARAAADAATSEFGRELRQVAEMAEAQLNAPPAGPTVTRADAAQAESPAAPAAPATEEPAGPGPATAEAADAQE